MREGGGVLFLFVFLGGAIPPPPPSPPPPSLSPLFLSSYRSVQNLRTLGLIACEADRIGIRGSRSWSSTCAVSSVIPRLLLLTDFGKREHPTTATARRSLYGARRASRIFSTDFFFFFLFFLFFFFFLFWGKEETVHEPLMIPLSSILHHTRTHTRPLDASRKHTPVARPSTAEAHTINQQKGQGHQKARERDKIFASRIGRHGVLCPFVFDTASTQHPQSSSGMASSSCHCWPTLPVGSGHSGCR